MYCGNTLVSHQSNSLLIIRDHMFSYKLCAIIRSNCILRNIVPVQKLIFPQRGKKFSLFKDAFVTGFRHLSLPSFKKIHAVSLKSTLILLLFHVAQGIPRGLSSSLFPAEPLYTVFLFSPIMVYTQSDSFFIL